MIHRQRLQRRFPDQSLVVLLKIEGNCSCLRAKVAHMVGHLPPGAATAQDVEDGIHDLPSLPTDRTAAWLGWWDQGGEDRPFSVGQIAAVVPPVHQWSPPCLQAKRRSDVSLSAAARCGPFSDRLLLTSA